jgi:hypothetical protein
VNAAPNLSPKQIIKYLEVVLMVIAASLNFHIRFMSASQWNTL